MFAFFPMPKRTVLSGLILGLLLALAVLVPPTLPTLAGGKNSRHPFQTMSNTSVPCIP